MASFRYLYHRQFILNYYSTTTLRRCNNVTLHIKWKYIVYFNLNVSTFSFCIVSLRFLIEVSSIEIQGI